MSSGGASESWSSWPSSLRSAGVVDVGSTVEDQGQTTRSKVTLGARASVCRDYAFRVRACAGSRYMGRVSRRGPNSPCRKVLPVVIQKVSTRSAVVCEFFFGRTFLKFYFILLLFYGPMSVYHDAQHGETQRLVGQ